VNAAIRSTIRDNERPEIEVSDKVDPPLREGPGLNSLRKKSRFARDIAKGMPQGLKAALIMRELCRG
jgi:hypothetical protein